ncbi:MAG: hypothetical protein HY026_10770 [Deltaproteobacteria bacterium]|nr:hypothetical protein [Deltaproteobacteria bacterium]
MEEEKGKHEDKMEAPGTFVLSIIFLAAFIVIWFAHFKWLIEIWGVR